MFELMPCGNTAPLQLTPLHSTAHTVTICSHQKWIEEQSSSISSKAQCQSWRAKSSNLKEEISFDGQVARTHSVWFPKKWSLLLSSGEFSPLLMFRRLRYIIWLRERTEHSSHRLQAHHVLQRKQLHSCWLSHTSKTLLTKAEVNSGYKDSYYAPLREWLHWIDTIVFGGLHL